MDVTDMGQHCKRTRRFGNPPVMSRGERDLASFARAVPQCLRHNKGEQRAGGQTCGKTEQKP